MAPDERSGCPVSAIEEPSTPDSAWAQAISAFLVRAASWRSQAPWWSGLAIGALAAGVGALARLALLGGSTTKLVYLTFFPVVIIAGLAGGLSGGTFATIFCSLLVYVVFDPPTNVTEWLGLAVFVTSSAFIVSVTEMLLRTRSRALTAEATHAILARLSAIVEDSSDAIISKTLDGTVTSWNAAATHLFCLSAEEMIGQPITRIIPPEFVEDESMILARIRVGQAIEQYETCV